uniref:Uncharacterized protein n=1 Tax=Acrobeloides nanus TaxID=290746 RepID=A0A914DTE6_9BILA
MDDKIPPLKSWDIQLDSPPFSWMSKADALNYAKVVQSYFRAEMEWKIKYRRHIEHLQVFHKTPSIKNRGFFKKFKKWYYYFYFSKFLNDESIKIGTRQAFHTIMTALQSGEMKNLTRCLLPGIADDRISNLEGSLPVDKDG